MKLCGSFKDKRLYLRKVTVTTDCKYMNVFSISHINNPSCHQSTVRTQADLQIRLEKGETKNP